MYAELKQRVKEHCPGLHKVLVAILKFYYRQRRKFSREIRETRKTFGPLNIDRTIYIIRRSNPSPGLFSHFLTNLGHMQYALERGYTPVVDMMNYPNLYLDKDQVGKVNAWEYFFEQPCGVSLEEAYNSKNVILSFPEPISGFHDHCMDHALDYHDDELKPYRELVYTCISIAPKAREYIDSQYAKLINAGDKVLGVLCRGTDYMALKPAGHAIQPESDAVIEKAKEVMEEYHCNKLFLASEDGGIIQRFQEHFGDKLIMTDAHIYDYDGERYIGYMTCDRKNDKYLRGLEYLAAIVILSRCNCLLGGANNGTTGAVLLNKHGFEYAYIWRLGRYPYRVQ